MNLSARIDTHLALASTRPGAASVLVFVIALLVRVSFALWLTDDILWIDGQRYAKIAYSLLAGQGFGSLAAQHPSEWFRLVPLRASAWRCRV